MRVVWTGPALADVLEIKHYIAADSPRYAQMVAERLFDAVDRLNAYPLSGRMVPELSAAQAVERALLLTNEAMEVRFARCLFESPPR